MGGCVQALWLGYRENFGQSCIDGASDRAKSDESHLDVTSDQVVHGWASASKGHHDMSHEGKSTQLTAVNNWYAQQFAYLGQALLAAQDVDGKSVLDNTLIYVMSEIGDGQDHTRVSEILYPQTPDYLPLVTIGKCGGAITSGQVVQFPIKEKATAGTVNRPAADLYLTMARAMGAANVTFPGQTGVLPGVLAS